jgi:hypothetical protein
LGKYYLQYKKLKMFLGLVSKIIFGRHFWKFSTSSFGNSKTVKDKRAFRGGVVIGNCFDAEFSLCLWGIFDSIVF